MYIYLNIQLWLLVSARERETTMTDEPYYVQIGKSKHPFAFRIRKPYNASQIVNWYGVFCWNHLRVHLQSKCFFFGPIISSVVALHTDFANPCPAKLCRAANNLSFIVCPAMFFSSFFCFSTSGFSFLFYSKNDVFFFFLFFLLEFRGNTCTVALGLVH